MLHFFLRNVSQSGVINYLTANNWMEFDWKVQNRYFRTLAMMAKHGKTSGQERLGASKMTNHINYGPVQMVQGCWREDQKEIQQIFNT